MAVSNHWQIVLIDDEEDIRDIMTVVLEDAGYAVASAADGEAGLRLCRKLLPQIVITDIRMPGMDGLQVLEVLKSEAPDVEVIVVTAFGEMELAVKALQLDASDFITKPVADDALHMALTRARQRYTLRKEVADYTALLERENANTVNELARSVAFRRNLIESSMDGIVGCDAEGLVISMNRSMEMTLGMSRGEILEKRKLSSLFAAGGEKSLREAMAAEKYGGPGRLYLYETVLVGSGNREIPVQVSASSMGGDEAGSGRATEHTEHTDNEGETGKNNGNVYFFRDLREIRKLEREVMDQARILHQDKMMSLGRLAASVVHEINNPLFGILNYIRLMIRIVAKGTLDSERLGKFRSYLDLVESETDRCAKIVSGLLGFARKSPPAFENVRVDELIDRCILLSHHKLELGHIVLGHSVEENLPEVKGDFNQLQQCVINLIFNAMDAMPEGGTLKLAARLEPADRSVRVTVADTGPGIPAEALPHIFEPFYTTKKEGHGVGLGLSTVYGIMERHGGMVSAENAPGGGALFTLRLYPKTVSAP